MAENPERYKHLTEPTFGTVVRQVGIDPSFKMMVYAPTYSEDAESWLAVSVGTTYSRFSNMGDIWSRVQDPNDTLIIRYDPRVDYEPL